MSRLQTDGFVVAPGLFAGPDFDALVGAYDRACAGAGPHEVRCGSTSVRVDDFVNRAPCFDPIYTHPVLLDGAAEVIGARVRLSSFHARTVRPGAAAQPLHQDMGPLADGWALVGFIVMIDAFRADNGATRFAPGSQASAAAPPPSAALRAACGPAGSMIVFNGCTWHGHGPNRTDAPRRSLQGALVRADQPVAVDYRGRMRPEVARRLSPLARALLALEPAAPSAQ